MQPQAAEAPLLATKLFVPRLRPNRVDRERLRERLDRSRHVVLVSAPAGSGKSTVLADWAAAADARVAWISLEASDDDPRRFLDYVLSALRQAEAIGWTEAPEYVHAPVPEVVRAGLAELLNSVGEGARPVILILDDYHVIESQRVHNIVQYVVDHLPPNLRLAISTRSDPPLTLSRLRARDMLTELRASDLRFSLQEADKFFNQSMGLHLPGSEVEELERRTEGWAVGLQMAALSMQGRRGGRDFVAGFTGSNRYVLDYLTEEVLAQQPEDVRDFLLETSILDRLSAPLCDAVTGHTVSERILQLLDASNLFLIALDEVRYWYRYHHLFGTLLQHHLSRTYDAEHIRNLQQRASDWHLENGSPDAAMRHAISAVDVERERDIVAKHGLRLLLKGDSATVTRWIKSLPAEDQENRVDLLVYQGSAAMLDFRMDVATERINRAEQLLTDDTLPQHRAGVYTARAMILRSHHRVAESLQYYDRALALVQPGTMWHSVMSFERGMGVMATGDLVGAEKALAYSRGEHDVPYANMTTMLAQCTTAASRFLRGRPDEAVVLANEGLRWIEKWDPDNDTGRPIAALPYAVLADVHRQWNDLSVARQFAELAMEHGRRGFRIGYFEGTKALLLVAEAENDWDAAARLNSEVLKGLLAAVNLNWSQALEWVYQRVVFRRGQRTGNRSDVDSVIAALTKAELLEPPYRVRERTLPSFYSTDAFMIAARVLVHQGRNSNALELLGEILDFSRERDCGLAVIETLVLRSLAEAATEDVDAAVTTMREAIDLASRPRFFRAFLDESASALPLIERAATKIKERDFVTALISSFDVRKTVSEVLSEREIDVLRLIAEGVSNQEAGRKLFISPSTVKKHLENIYGKLAVGGRVEAIARARELRLL